MGMTPASVAFFQAVVTDPRNLRILEFGDQLMIPPLVASNGHKYVTAKEWLNDQAVAEHVSVDINGLNGALPLDLCQPLPPEFFGRFHVVTNFGTMEHIKNQYQGWKNLFQSVMTGGISIHEMPGQSGFNCHDGEPYFRPAFFEKLCAQCGCSLIGVKDYIYQDVTGVGDKTGVAIQAVVLHNSTIFPTEETFAQMPINRT